MEEVMHFSLIKHGALQAVEGDDIEIRIDKSQPHVVLIRELREQKHHAVMDWVSSIMQKLVEDQKISQTHSEARIETSAKITYSGTFTMEREEWGAFTHHMPIIRTWNKTTNAADNS